MNPPPSLKKKFLLITTLGSLVFALALFAPLTFGSLSGGHESTLFNDYEQWSHSYSPKTNESNPSLYSLLYRLANDYQIVTNSATPVKFSLLDINGDGLSDFLYHEKYLAGATAQLMLAAFLNTGDSDFQLVYKCFENHSSGHDYYGDCAAGSSPSSPEANMLGEISQIMNHCHIEWNGHCRNFGLADLNGDGLTDLLHPGGIDLNQGDLRFSRVNP